MTWSLQLTYWALPPLLGVLVVLRDVEYLWPRRREHGARALMVASLAGGLWAFLALVAIISPAVGAKSLVESIEYVPGAFAPLAWVAFAFTYARRRRDLRRWPFIALCVPTLVTLVIVFRGDPGGLLLKEFVLVDLRGAGGLQVVHGWWHWVHVGVRATALVGASIVLARNLARNRARGAIGWVIAGCVLALAPAVVQLSAVPGAVWADQTPTGFAIGANVLALGLVRRRFLDLGPVARTIVMNELRDPIVVMDGRGRIVDTNRAAERVLGLRPYGDVPVALGTFWASSRTDAVPSARMELEVPGDAARTFEVTVSRMGGDGRTGHAAVMLLDITEQVRMHQDLLRSQAALRQANADLERLANTDGLTGLANRRRFMEALDREVDRAQRYDRPLSLVLLDLDHFKMVNDTHGHPAGDEVLRAAARVLESVCREVDLAARIGGEELALILPETWTQGARTVAERVRERIAAEHHRAPSGAAFRVTGSIGVASLGRGISDGGALLQAADEALYRAKSNGRNQVAAAD